MTGVQTCALPISLSKTFIVDDFKYNKLSKNKVELISYLGQSKTIKIPEDVEVNEDEYDVTMIGSSAFESNTNVEAISIPEKVTIIKKKAFYSCVNLEKVEFGDDLKEIQEEAFMNCTSLKSIAIPEHVSIIGNKAFAGCNLEYVSFSNALKKVGINSFYMNNKIKKVNVKGSAKDVYYNGILYSEDFKTIVLRKAELKSLTLHEKLITIPECFFKDMEFSKRNIVLNNNLEIISNEAFMNSSIKRLEIFYNVKTIGDKAFYGCYSLSEIVFHNSPTTVGVNAFTGTSLQNTIIQIPRYFVELKTNAFSDIQFKQINIESCDTKIKEDSFSINNDTCIRVPDKCTESMEQIFGFKVNQPRCPRMMPTQTQTPLYDNSKSLILIVITAGVLLIIIAVVIIVLVIIHKRKDTKFEYENIYDDFQSVEQIGRASCRERV